MSMRNGAILELILKYRKNLLKDKRVAWKEMSSSQNLNSWSRKNGAFFIKVKLVLCVGIEQAAHQSMDMTWTWT